MYWSETGLCPDLIADAMPVNRFEQILRLCTLLTTTHWTPKMLTGLSKSDQSWMHSRKPSAQHLMQKNFSLSMRWWFPTRDACLSNNMSPKNPSPGEVWVRAGSSGYLYNFEPYQGPAGGRGEITQQGMAGDVVMRLCEDIQDKNHKVFFDNFFCTISLLQALEHQGIYGTGTCRSNRLHGAQERLNSEKQLKQKGRGSVSWPMGETSLSHVGLIVQWFTWPLPALACPQ